MNNDKWEDALDKDGNSTGYAKDQYARFLSNVKIMETHSLIKSEHTPYEGTIYTCTSCSAIFKIFEPRSSSWKYNTRYIVISKSNIESNNWISLSASMGIPDFPLIKTCKETLMEGVLV